MLLWILFNIFLLLYLATYVPSQSDLSPLHGIALGGEANNYNISENFDIENESISRSILTENNHKRSSSAERQ